MAVRWDHLLDSHLAAPHPPAARVRQNHGPSARSVLPDREPSPLSMRSRLLSVVTRLAAPVSAPSTRNRRSFVGVPAAVVGWLLGPRLVTDVDSLADHERARAALTRVTHQIAADRDAWTSHVGVPAYPVGRGSS